MHFLANRVDIVGSQGTYDLYPMWGPLLTEP